MYQGNGTNIIMNSHKHVWLSIIYFDILITQTPKTYSPTYTVSNQNSELYSSLMVFKFYISPETSHFTLPLSSLVLCWGCPLIQQTIIAVRVHHLQTPRKTCGWGVVRMGFMCFAGTWSRFAKGSYGSYEQWCLFDGTVVRRGHASFMCTYFYILTEKVVFHTCPWRQES